MRFGRFRFRRCDRGPTRATQLGWAAWEAITAIAVVLAVLHHSPAVNEALGGSWWWCCRDCLRHLEGSSVFKETASRRRRDRDRQPHPGGDCLRHPMAHRVREPTHANHKVVGTGSGRR